MRKSGFVEGTIIATAAIIITKILGILYVIPFYAIVGVQGSALYAYAYNIYLIFLDISSAGIQSAMSQIIKEYNTLGNMDAKRRAYKIGKKIIFLLSFIAFMIMFCFAPLLAKLILGDLTGGNTIADVTLVIRSISFAILIIPFLSVSKGYLQGHNVISVSSISQVIEQFVRIAVIIAGSYVALRVFNLPIGLSVAIAVLGAFVGGAISVLYVKLKMNKNKKELSLIDNNEKSDVTDKEIFKKIIHYATSFIIVSIAVSIYGFVDMVFISRTMGSMGLSASETEFITSSVTTWAPKIGMIINSIAMGLAVSLIPNMVEANTLKRWDKVEEHLNKGMQIVLSVCIPMAIGIAMLSKSVWAIFYGVEELSLGSLILSIYIFQPLFFNLYLVTSTTMQGLNKFKMVYLSTILGYATNALLDVPLMYLCKYIGLKPFIGAIIASIIGYTLSILIVLIHLNKKHNIKYNETFKIFIKTLLPSLVMIIVVYLMKLIVPVNYTSKLSCVLYIGLISIVGAVSYLFIAFKQDILYDVFGKEYLSKLISKLTFNKIKLS
jgi:O-antigen/teichoic acid export membrane protein